MKSKLRPENGDGSVSQANGAVREEYTGRAKSICEGSEEGERT